MPKTENRMSIGNWITIGVAVAGFTVSGTANYYAGESDRALIRQQMETMQTEYRAMIMREENERKAADARIEQYNNSQLQMFRSDMRDMSSKVDKIYDIVAGVRDR